MHHPRKILAFIAVTVVLLTGASALATGIASAAVSHEQIKGSGSSWAAVAMQQWIQDVSPGMEVVYSPNGSEQGRQDFANGVTDFAVSDIGYQGTDPETNVADASNRPYAYVPLVAGGTAFPYHLTVGGKQVTNLRLSQETLAKIFTDNITNWDDPAITADNNGVALPSIPIIPVVHSEGAGTSYQVSDWLSTEFPALWQNFSGVSLPGQEWPTGKGSQQAEAGSDAVMSFIDSSGAQGAIGIDEYAYALQQHAPVADVENAAGYFTAPTPYNVAVALTQAQVNTDPNPADCAQLGFPTSPCYLLANLSKVWDNHDPRTYPLSSYSYLIEPTSATGTVYDASGDREAINTAKRQSIVDFATWGLCKGQSEVGSLGYAPLPENLVQAGFEQLGLLHNADPNVSMQNVNLAQCQNPTFDPTDPQANHLSAIAPLPPACAQAGHGPCANFADEGNPPGAPSVPGSTQFGTVPVGHSTNQTVQVTNGSALPVVVDLKATKQSLAGSNYSVTGGSCINPAGTVTLPASGSCSLNVTFKPSAFGLRASSLQLWDNAGHMNIDRLQGTGAAGYYLADARGRLVTLGASMGSLASTGAASAAPVVGIAADPSGGSGAWMVTANGGISSYGDARLYGSPSSMHLNKPVVGMASTPDGNGYWLVASDGGIFAYGDARFYGSTGSMHLNKPVVGMVASPAGDGYWLAASDGGIFSFNVPFEGSAVGRLANVVGVAPTAT